MAELLTDSEEMKLVERLKAEGIVPSGWFNPWNDYHGFQQVAADFEGDEGTIPLFGADTIARLVAERDEARMALEPFASFAENVDENGWTSDIHREQVSTWFGPSDFRRARAALQSEGAKQ